MHPRVQALHLQNVLLLQEHCLVLLHNWSGCRTGRARLTLQIFRMLCGAQQLAGATAMSHPQLFGSSERCDEARGVVQGVNESMLPGHRDSFRKSHTLTAAEASLLQLSCCLRLRCSSSSLLQEWSKGAAGKVTACAFCKQDSLRIKRGIEPAQDFETNQQPHLGFTRYQQREIPSIARQRPL